MKSIVIIGTTSSNLYLFRKDFIVSCLNKGMIVHTFVSEPHDYWDDKIEKTGAILIKYQMNRGGLNPFLDLFSLFQLKSSVNKIKPDIVFSFFTKPVVYGSLAAKLAKTPKIIGMIEGLGSPFTEHKNGYNFKMKLVRFFQVSLYRIVFPFLDKIIFLNKDDPIDLINNNKIYHKPNAVKVLGPIGLNLDDYPYKLWDESQEFSFIFVARLLVEKGIYEYLEAAQIVKEKYPNIIFKVVGGIDSQNPSGVTKQELDKIIATGIIHYIGFSNNVAEEIKNSTVFVLPSYREGVPRSTQEAMAIGRPIITTDVPGCRDTVLDGVNGFLVPKWDVKALVDRMCFFIGNPEQINIMGKESYKIACAQFDVDKVNKKLSKIMGIND